METAEKFITTVDSVRTVPVTDLHGTTWATTVISYRDWLAGKYAGCTDKITMCYSHNSEPVGEYYGQLVGHSESNHLLPE